MYRDGVCNIIRGAAALTHRLSAGAHGEIHTGLTEEGIYGSHVWQLGLASEAIVVRDG